jgi:TonB family protein
VRPRDVGLLALVVLAASACTTMPTPAPTVIDLDARPAHVYIQDVKARIQSGLTYPCLKNTRGGCEPRDARVVVEFGILRDGTLRYVDVVAPSGQTIYDTESAEAIRRAAPFPPVPVDLMARVPPESTGIPIRANFHFVVDQAR